MHEPDHQDYLPPRVFAFDRCPPLAPAVKQSELISAQSFVLGTRNHTQPAERRLGDSMSRSTRSPCDWGSLERQLQSKLNLSRCRHRAQNSAGARVHHACGQQSSPVCLVGYPEVRMVEDVEHLGAEVQRLGLPQCELLEEREIAAHEFRANQRRSEEHTSELQSRLHLVCRLLLEKKKKHV